LKKINYFTLFLVFILVARLVFLFTLNHEELLTYIPDDSFYYMEISKNFIKNGFWSFDNMNPSSGFHIMYGYFLSLIMLLTGVDNFYGIFIIVSLTNISLIAVSYNSILKLFYQRFPSIKFLPLFLLTTFLSKVLIINSTYILESSFTILFSSLLIYYVFSIKKENFLFLKIGVISMLGQAFRLDFGLITFVIFIFFCFNKRSRQTKYILPLLSASFVLILQIVHNQFLGLDFPPSSSIIKSFWAEQRPFIVSFKAITSLVLTDSIFITIGSFFIFYSIKKKHKALLISDNLLKFSLLSLVLYIILYTKNGAVQNWYIQNIHSLNSVIHLFFLIIFFQYVKTKNIKNIIVVFWILITYNISISMIPIWPNQSLMYFQALSLDDKKIEKVGVFDAGIIGYFTKKAVVVNLDGLINDNVVSSILSNKMEKYLRDNEIKFISNNFLIKDDYKGISNSLINKLNIVDSIEPKFINSNILTKAKIETHYLYELYE
jgi:hypothetical protein